MHLALLGSHTLRSLQMKHRSAASFSNCTIGTNGTNRRLVYARLPGANICSLQLEHWSAASFSIGVIGTNGTNEMQFANGIPMDWGDFIGTNGANRKASLTNGDLLPMVPLAWVSWRLVSVCVCCTCVLVIYSRKWWRHGQAKNNNSAYKQHFSTKNPNPPPSLALHPSSLPQGQSGKFQSSTLFLCKHFPLFQ